MGKAGGAMGESLWLADDHYVEPHLTNSVGRPRWQGGTREGTSAKRFRWDAVEGLMRSWCGGVAKHRWGVRG
jgi:hypothetical protein